MSDPQKSLNHSVSTISKSSPSGPSTLTTPSNLDSSIQNGKTTDQSIGHRKSISEKLNNQDKPSREDPDQKIMTTSTTNPNTHPDHLSNNSKDQDHHTTTTLNPDSKDDGGDDGGDDDDDTSSENEINPDEADGENDGPLVDMDTFGQLLEMDDDDEHSFSKSLTIDYFDQAVATFKEMDTAVLAGDLITLSRKGHFLKGSSAALGLNRVKASCEKMQHYGNKKKANGEGVLSESEAMKLCKSLLRQLKEEQRLSKAWLERFYAERNL